MTLERLAEKVGSSKSYMWELENKEVARPSAEKLRLIALALDTTSDYLVAGQSDAPATEADNRFFRKYMRLDDASKRRLRRILDTLDEEQD